MTDYVVEVDASNTVRYRCRRSHRRAILFLSSLFFFFNDTATTEIYTLSLHDALPISPYGVAKRALLVQAQAYRAQYGLNAIYLLPVNLYGPNDNFDLEDSHVIPALIRKCVEAVDEGRDILEVWGSGNATREFLYVEDCARGIVLATRDYDGSRPVNLGSGREISIRDLVGFIAGLTGFKGSIRWNPARPDGQPRRRLDISRAEAFGFSAAISLEDGLARTVKWYREHGRET